MKVNISLCVCPLKAIIKSVGYLTTTGFIDVKERSDILFLS